jgi:hypothetical protein
MSPRIETLRNSIESELDQCSSLDLIIEWDEDFDECENSKQLIQFYKKVKNFNKLNKNEEMVEEKVEFYEEIDVQREKTKINNIMMESPSNEKHTIEKLFFTMQNFAIENKLIIHIGIRHQIALMDLQRPISGFSFVSDEDDTILSCQLNGN